MNSKYVAEIQSTSIPDDMYPGVNAALERASSEVFLDLLTLPVSFIESNSQRLNNNSRKETQKQTQKTISTVKKTITKSDSGREHVRRMIGIFWFWWGCEEILRALVIE